MNLTGVGVDDPDVNLYENYTCNSERNYTQYCNKEVDKLIDQQSAGDSTARSARRSCGRSRGSWPRTSRGPIILQRAATCWQPQVKGFVLQHNSIYNGWRFEDVWLDK